MSSKCPFCGAEIQGNPPECRGCGARLVEADRISGPSQPSTAPDATDEFTAARKLLVEKGGRNRSKKFWGLAMILMGALLALWSYYYLMSVRTPSESAIDSRSELAFLGQSSLLQGEDWVKMGEEQLIPGNYQEAVSAYTKAIELGVKDRFVYFSRGMAFKGLGDYNRAILDFDKKIEYAPDD